MFVCDFEFGLFVGVLFCDLVFWVCLFVIGVAVLWVLLVILI